MQDLPLDDAYRLLELQPGATANQIREAYRVLSRVWHPDRFAGSPEMQARATARQQELNAAYQRLLQAQRSGRSAADAATDSMRTPAGASRHDPRRQPANGDSSAEEQRAAAPPPPAPAAQTAGPPHERFVAAVRAALDAWRAQPRAVRAAIAVLPALAGLLALGLLARDGVVRAEDGTALRGAAVSAGGTQACTIDGSRLWCWGGIAGGAQAGGSGRAEVVALPARALSLAGGLLHSCALLEDGSAHCWGGNILGQLGTRGLQDHSRPTRVAFDGAFAALSALGRHTCGVTTAGSLYCWGDDADGQLGIGRPAAACRLGKLSFFCSDRPERIGREGQWRTVAAGGGHTCAIDADGALHCWGSNRFGQLGGAADERCTGAGGAAPCRRRPARVALDAPVSAVAAGASHTCALDTDGRAYCWGLNAQWQTGSDGGRTVPAPTAVATELRFRSLVAGAYHTCGITARGALFCWGSDMLGELRGRAPDRCDGAPCAARAVRLATGIADAAAGFGLTCTRRRDGLIRCWGEGSAERPAERVAGGGANLRVRGAGLRMRLDAARSVLYRNILQPLEQAL